MVPGNNYMIDGKGFGTGLERGVQTWGTLSNLRVVDLTQVLAGPYCTMLLADLGADVVKIERPGGDMIRSNRRSSTTPKKKPTGATSRASTAAKEHRTEPRRRRDRANFLSLIEEADVVVENYRSGTMEKYDLGYETLKEHNPDLIYSSIRGFGDPRTGETERQGQPSFDLIAQALGGVMETTGQPDGPPTKTGPGVGGDLFTATLNCIGILAAVNHREQTGEGQYVDTAMYDSMLSFTERAVYQQSYTGEAPTRRGNSHPTLFPYNAFETDDGYAVIAAFNNNHWAELCDVMDREDLAEAYPTTPERLENRDALRAELAEWAADLTNDELVGKLEGRVPAAPVQTTEEIFDDPHVYARGISRAGRTARSR